MEDGPSRLHDAISNILGLEEFTAIKASLADRKSAWKAKLKASKDAWTLLAAELGGSSDPRAKAIVAASAKKGFDPISVEALLAGDDEGNETLAGWCRSIGSLSVLSLDAVAQHVLDARNAFEAVGSLAGSGAQTALATAKLLQQAIALHASELSNGAAAVKDLTAAEDWVSELSGEVRDQRLAPIRTAVEVIWDDLRCDSNITLSGFELTGSGTRRRVQLELSVDNTPAPTLGVLSQGEMHALALSLFLPRASLDESPFRFLVIDDPVQAMDPSKVDGLARQLAKAAETRQVIVLTHDDRLPEAVRRLGIDARVLEVVRGTKSGVRIETSIDPTERRLKNAMTNRVGA